MPPKTKHPVLILTQAGDVNPATISAAGPLTLAAIQTHLKKKKGVEIVATYKAKQIILTLFGVAEGTEETQNQHQLPPPHDSDMFYGDLVLVASKLGEENSHEKPILFKPDEYEEFYTKMFDGGYESDEEAVEGAEADVVDVEEDIDIDADADADDVEEGKEFDEEEEEEDGEEEEVEEAVADGEEDAPVPKVKAKKKKAVAKTGPAAALAGTGSAYASPPLLSEEEQLQEEDGSGVHTDATASPRRRILAALEGIFKDILSVDALAAMERCIYNGAIKQARARHVVRSWEYPLFVHLYKMHAMHITSNFHPASYVKNTELYDSFQKGDATFDTIAAMNTYELFPSHWREMFEQRQVREKKQLEGNRDRATDQFTCTRCWKKECTYYEMQTRSADEPMTIFITCLNCGKKWRQ